MDKINKLNSVVNILRSQLTRTQEDKSKKAPLPKGKAATAPRPDIKELERQVINRIGKINPDADDYKHRSIRVLVESILVWEFGDEILNDPDCDVLLGNIVEGLDASDITGLVDQFLKQGKPKI